MIILYTLLTSKKCKAYCCVCVKISEKENIKFSSLRSRYNRLANRKKLILPLEKFFKTLKNMIIDTEPFIIFQSGLNNSVKLWAVPGAFPD